MSVFCRICDKTINNDTEGRNVSQALSLAIFNYYEVDTTKDGPSNSTRVHNKCHMNVSLNSFSENT